MSVQIVGILYFVLIVHVQWTIKVNSIRIAHYIYEKWANVFATVNVVKFIIYLFI